MNQVQFDKWLSRIRRLRKYEKEIKMIRWLSAISAGLVGLNAFLIGLPGDAVAQGVLYGVGGAAVFLSLMVAKLASPSS